MTNEQAIAHFKEQIEIFGGEHHEAMKVAIEALEKQIPKKPKYIKVQNTSFTKAHSRCVCPICNERVDDDGRGYEQPYCMECGQALDWGE